MTCGTGAMAKSLAGHDKGEIYVIIEEKGEYLFLVNGSGRPLTKPKRKNKKHIQIIHDSEEQSRKHLIEGKALTDKEVDEYVKSRCY